MKKSTIIFILFAIFIYIFTDVKTNIVRGEENKEVLTIYRLKYYEAERLNNGASFKDVVSQAYPSIKKDENGQLMLSSQTNNKLIYSIYEDGTLSSMLMRINEEEFKILTDTDFWQKKLSDNDINATILDYYWFNRFDEEFTFTTDNYDYLSLENMEGFVKTDNGDFWVHISYAYSYKKEDNSYTYQINDIIIKPFKDYIHSGSFYLDNEEVELENGFIFDGNYPLFPFRSVLEEMGAEVEYDKETGYIYFHYLNETYMVEFNDIEGYKFIIIKNIKYKDSDATKNHIMLNPMGGDGGYYMINNRLYLDDVAGERLLKYFGYDTEINPKDSTVKITNNGTGILHEEGMENY